MLYIELDKPDPVVEELLPLVSHKTPKVIVAALSALTAIYHAYGCKTVEPKPVIKILPKVYDHKDKTVRAEAQNLTVELYRWLKDAMKPLFWNDLKPVQQTDLEKLFEKVKDEPAPKQERLLRSQQEAQEAAAEAGPGEDGEGAGDDEDGGEIDLEPEYMAVDVFPKVPKDLNERLASSKWKDRKEVLDEVFTAVNVPAIQEGPFDDIIRGCAKSMKDANIAVVTVAANCVECIAKGLRKQFAKYRSSILSPMLERLKEKKQSVTDALGAACDAVFLSAGLSDILEEVLGFLAHKNPQVKLESTRFLTRCLKTTKEAPQPPEVKSMADAATKLLTDSQAPQRDAGAEVLGVLWKIMGDRNMLMHLEGLDEIRKTKIKEFCDQAEVKAKWKPKAAPAPKPAAKPAAAAPAAKRPALGKRPAGTVKKPAPASRPISPPEEPAQETAPLQPKPTSRPGSKLAPKPGLAPPGSGLKKPGLGGSVSSPRKVTASAPAEEPAAPAPRGLGGAGRGLAARPLGKPVPTEAAYEPTPVPAASSGPSSALSMAERAELSDLRAEVELLRSQNSDLRTDKLRLQSQIHELQNQNAQLIEDHTRDVLSVKAKETQLVRARSDAEAAEERCRSLEREAERLKREVGRLGRQGRESPVGNDFGDHGAANGYGTGTGMARPGYGNATRGYSNVADRNVGGYGNGGMGMGVGMGMGDGEGKENLPEAVRERKPSPAFSAPSSKPLSDYSSSGRASPALSSAQTLSERTSESMGAPTGLPVPSGGAGLGSSGLAGAGAARGSVSRSTGDGNVESWKRAAEVTQNLKARIEMMKVRYKEPDCWTEGTGGG